VDFYFQSFNSPIKEAFGLEIKDFIDIYNYIDSLPNKFFDEKFNRYKGEKSWKDFATEMIEKDISPEDWVEYMPQGYKNMLEFLPDQGAAHRFSVNQLSNEFGKDKASAFLQALVCERREADFLFYTERNVLDTKPIFKVGTDLYQVLEMNQIIHAIYNTLFEFCKSLPDNGAKFYKVRGKKLEDKIEEIFQGFFKGKAHVYKGYFMHEGHEQDLLFLIDGLALIVEAKSSKRDEPLRDPVKAYPLILQNFKKTIQEGYDQAYRVKSKFIRQEVLKIYDDDEKKRHLFDIKTKHYQNAFTIIVTLEKFGHNQTDLSELLEINDDDVFPWSVDIDSLEVFLLKLKKEGKNFSALRQFLILREKLHGNILCGDELEICGDFINNKMTHKSVNTEQLIRMTPASSKVFDDDYLYGGLGFKNEKNIERKRRGGYLVLGDSRPPKKKILHR
jgi:hypothetical protein